MRFVLSASVIAVFLSACASASTPHEGAGRTDTQKGAASGAEGGAPEPVPPAYNPCAGKNTGDTCTVCAPGDTDCTETGEVKACDASGACTSKTTPPAYDPCAGKSPGDTCTLCAPGDADCVETAVLKACDASGTCK